MSEAVTLIVGIVGIVFAIVGGGATILFVCLSAVRAVKRESDEFMQLHRSEVSARIEAQRLEVQERIEALRRELSERIEAVRMEIKNDRHNYVQQIDSVLKEIQGNIADLEKGVAVLISRADTMVALKRVLQGEDNV